MILSNINLEHLQVLDVVCDECEKRFEASYEAASGHGFDGSYEPGGWINDSCPGCGCDEWTEVA